MLSEFAAKPSNERTILIVAFAAAIMLVGIVVSLPVYTLVGVVPDDAYYYMVVGRNIATTGVSTFDGENLASGYHPGWMVLVTMVAKFFPGNDALLRIVVAMALLLHALAGWLLYLCLRRLVSGIVAALAACFWLFGHLPLVIASFAMETNLYCVVFLLSYLVYLKRIAPHLRWDSEEAHDRIPAKDLLVFGAATGLCLWARTEAVVLLACIVTWLGLATLRRQGFMNSLIEACRRCILTGTAATLVIAPWFLYCLHTFGTIRQASGAMKMLWRSQEVAGLGWGSRLAEFGERFGLWIAYVLPWAWGSGFGIGVTMAVAWIGLFIAAWVYIARRPQEVRRAIASTVPAIAYPLLHVFVAGVVYSIFFADVQCWYLALPYLEVYLVIAILGGVLWQTATSDDRAKTWPAKALAVAIVFTVVGLVRYGLTLEKGYWAWQRDVYASIGPVDRLTPAGARIGCFNAGIPGYYSHRKIINLDGLVNNAIVPYWRAKNFERYLIDARINAIYDEDLSLTRAEEFSHGLPELDVVARYPLTNYVVDTRYLWMLKPSGPRQEKPSR
jgi:hypothetical protein